MSEPDDSGGGWVLAIASAAVLGIIFALASALVAGFYIPSNAIEARWIRPWNWYFGGIAGTGVMLWMLWLFHTKRVNVSTIRESIQKLLNEVEQGLE